VEGDEIDMEGCEASRARAVLIVPWQRRSSEGATTEWGALNEGVWKFLPYKVIGMLNLRICNMKTHLNQ
jgi:hypothetical protein